MPILILNLILMKRNFLFLIGLVFLTNISYGQAPSDPTLTSVTQQGTNLSIVVDWAVGGPSDSLELEVTQTAPTSGPTTKFKVPGTDVSAVISSLSDFSTYSVRMRAFDNSTILPRNVANRVYSGYSATRSASLVTFSLSNPNPVGIDNVTRNSFRVYWNDNSTNEDGYEIELKAPGTGIPTLTYIVGPNVTARFITGLNPNVRYIAYVRAYKGSTKSTDGIWEARTLLDFPPKPEIIGFSKNCPKEVFLAFKVTERLNEIEDFVVSRSLNNSSFVQIKTVPANGGSVYTIFDGDVVPGQRYFYRVTSRNINSSQITNSEVFTDVVQSYIKPSPITQVNGVVSARTTNSIKVTWVNPADQDRVCNTNVATVNYVSASVNGGDYKIVGYTFPGTSEFTIVGLNPKDIVDVKVWSQSELSGLISSSAFGRDTTLGPPYAPSDLVATPGVDALGNEVVKLNWKDNSNDETGFIIEYGNKKDEFVYLARIKSNQKEFVHLPITPGIEYFYRVKAFNKFGDSKYSAPASTIVEVSKAPNAPYNLIATINGGAVDLKWSDDATTEDSFEIERSDNGGTSFTKIGQVAKNILIYKDATVVAGKKYIYRVKAVNAKGSSAYSLQETVEIKPATGGSIKDNGIGVYPNPTVDRLSVTLPSNLVGSNATVQIIDKNSRVLYTNKLKLDSDELQLDLSKYSEGLYTVVISTKDSKIAKKVYKY
jgi:hypothetical protein